MARTLKQFVFFMVASLIVSPVFATSTTQMNHHIDKIVSTLGKHIHAGIKVVRLSDGATIYQNEPTRVMVPASNQKIYIDAAALLYFGPKYHFKTQLLTNAPSIKQEVLHGDLYVKLDGDPSFTSNDLESLMHVLKEYQVKEVTGNVYIDTSVFKDEPYSPGSARTDRNHAYGVRKTPIIIDENFLRLTVNAASRPGVPADVKLRLNNKFVKLDNRITTEQYGRTCHVLYHLKNDLRLVATGCIYAGHNSVSKNIPILKPVNYTKQIILKIFKEYGIKFDGDVKLAKAPKSVKRMAIHYSPPLLDIVRKTLKVSNNMYADAVFLKLGQAYYAEPGNWELGANANMQILHDQAGLTFGKTKFADGSGLSRYNKTSAAQMTKLLSYMYANFPIAYEFMTSLPKSGHEGSLVKRLNNRYMTGWIRAKTGTMSGITSLSGYLTSKNQQLLAFSMIINGPGSARTFRRIQDKICDYISNTNITGHTMTPEQKRVSHQRGSKPKHFVPRFAYVNQYKARRRIDREEARIRRNVKASDIAVLRHDSQIRVMLPETKMFVAQTGELTGAYRKYLKGISRVIRKNPDAMLSLEVIGKRTAKDNKVRQTHAQAIAYFLSKHGVKSSNILQVYTFKPSKFMHGKLEHKHFISLLINHT